MRSREPAASAIDPTKESDVAEWCALAARCPDATVFQHPDWILPWHAHLGAGIEPWLVGVRAGGDLIGLAPLGVAGGRVAFLGGEVSDHLGLLAAPHARARVATAVLEHLAAERARWDEAVLARLAPSSSLLAVPIPPALRASHAAGDVCPYVSLPSGARSLSEVLPRGFARRVRQSLSVARRAGRYEVRWIAADEVSPFVETLFALHEARWALEQQRGVLARQDVRAFWRDAMPALSARGLSRFLEIRLEGEPIAAYAAFARRGRVLSYLGGFDPRAAKLSPGRLALAALFERSIAEGAHEIDFLRGAEPYKYDWGARDRTTHVLRLEHAA